MLDEEYWFAFKERTLTVQISSSQNTLVSSYLAQTKHWDFTFTTPEYYTATSFRYMWAIINGLESIMSDA